MSETQAPAASPEKTYSGGYRTWVLFILIVVYTFNFIDRQILGILKEPVKADLGLTDSQLGWLGGWAFAIFYAVMGVPIAYLADRTNRTWIMTISLTLWSGFTAICGLAMNYWQLFLARLGVGVGEAGGVAPAYSIIADYFPPDQRGRALALYSLGIPIGSALGIIGGAILAEVSGWRTAFIVVGVMGIAIAPIFKLTVREPKRGQFDTAVTPTKAPSFVAVLRTLIRKPAFWTMSFGAASSSMMGYALIFWLPSFFYRSFGDTLPTFFEWMPTWLVPNDPGPLLWAGYFYGGIIFFGGIVGIMAGGILADRFGKASKGAYAMIPAVAFTLTVPLFLVGLLNDNLLTVFIAFLAIQTLSLVWLGPVITAFQHLVPPTMRSTASAIFLLINNFIGIGLGTWAIGVVSDSLTAQYGDEALRYSLLSGLVLYSVAALLMYITAPRLRKDWEGA